MERQRKTSGIVLRRFDLNEADQIVTVLTQEQGKVALLAKGSRRLKSRFCGRLEPFYHLRLNYFQGRELGHLDEAEILEVYTVSESDLRAKSILFFMAEVTAKLLPDGDDCHDAYCMLNDCLRQFEDSRCEILLHAYLIKLLTLLGFMAPWDVCSRSNLKFDLGEPLFLSMRDASVLRRAYAENGDIRLTPSVIKWVNYMQKEDFSRLKLVTPSHGEKTEVYLIMRTVFGSIFSFPFKSEAFLQAVSH